MKFQIKVIMVLVLVMLASCKKIETGAIMQEFYDGVKAGNYEKIGACCSEVLFENITEEEFKKMLIMVKEKLGDLESFEETNRNVNSSIGTNNSGVRVNLVYKVKYSKYEATEKFTLMKDKDTGKIKITGYFVNSKGFISE